jgi:arylformamidase
MKLYDVSRILDKDTLVYPGDPEVEREICKRIAQDGFAMEVFKLGSHAGTHLDAPAHVLPAGATIDRIMPEPLNGPARVLTTDPAAGLIGADFLSQHLSEQDLRTVERLLLHACNRRPVSAAFDFHHPSLSLDGAEFLRDKTAVKLIGIDTLSIENGSDATLPVHRTLLKADILILESLDFETEQVADGDYELICAPLRIRNADGAPCRALLRDLGTR